MRLRHLTIENFRGIRTLDLDLDSLTVVIAENNRGKTSIFDVLGLCLGPRGIDPETRFRDEDFFRAPDGFVGAIRLVLTFAPRPTDEESPDHHEVHVEFRGTRADPRMSRRFVDATGAPLDPQPGSDALDAIHRRHPFLLLRFAQPQGEGRDTTSEDGPPAPAERRGRRRLAATLGRVYRDLSQTRGPVPAERISQGLVAAFDLLDGEPGDAAPMHRMLSDLRSEVRRWNQEDGDDDSLGMLGSGSHNLALLLVLGSLLDADDGGGLARDARPIIAIEEPESHLHPILLASTWDVIEALHAQTVVTTNSGDLISSVPMAHLRRLVRSERGIDVHRLHGGTLSARDERRVAYHIRTRRGGVLFARCWMLVEGETEFWLLSQLARVMGYELEAEGVRPIEFAQCGVTPLVKLANDLGIGWHLLADGDESGQIYVRDATKYLKGAPKDLRISMLGYRDIEHCLWREGFEQIFRDAARIAPRPDGGGPPPDRIIAKAVRRRSKPHLALEVAEQCAELGKDSIPAVLRGVVEASVRLARDETDYRRR